MLKISLERSGPASVGMGRTFLLDVLDILKFSTEFLLVYFYVCILFFIDKISDSSQCDKMFLDIFINQKQLWREYLNI